MKKKMLFLISGFMLMIVMNLCFQSNILADGETDHLFEMPNDGNGSGTGRIYCWSSCGSDPYYEWTYCGDCKLHVGKPNGPTGKCRPKK